jgi:DNA-binding transcriptional LysR family regulator
MAFELQQLRQVLALAEHGSFVRAAAAMHISQPALSRSIQALEKRFGSNLFERSNAGVVPTDLGRLYIERARDLLRLADELDREAVGRGNLRTGHVAVGGGPYPAESVLGIAAARFAEQYPNISIRVQVRYWDDLLRQLRGRELDFFLAEVSTFQQEQDIDVVPMTSVHPLFFVARAEHPLARKEDVTVAEVLSCPFVAPSRIPPRVLEPLLVAERTRPKPAGEQRPFPSIECGALATVKRIIEHSDTVTAFSLTCIESELASGRYVILSTAPWMLLRYGVVSLKGRPMTHAAGKFLELVVEAERLATLEEERLLAQWRPDISQQTSTPGAGPGADASPGASTRAAVRVRK